MNITFRLARVAAAAVLLFAPYASAQTGASAVPLAVAPVVTESPVYAVIPGVKIERAEFGVISDLGSTAASLKPTRVVMRNNQPFGWVIALQTQKSEVRWREELTMPVPPEKWGVQSDSTDVRAPMISADRRTATTERRSVPAGGTVNHTWKFDASDPTGPHTMRVYVEDALVATFEFDAR